MFDKEAKLNELALVIEGKVVDDSDRVEVCIKGTVLGFPATIEALRANFPFGASFFLETDVLNEHNSSSDQQGFTLTISPKVVTGFWANFSRILLIDHQTKLIGDKRFDNHYLAVTNNDEEARRFIRYPAMMDKIILLSRTCSFTEVHIRAGHGLVTVQPTSIEKLDGDVVRESFRVMGEMAQVMFEAF